MENKIIILGGDSRMDYLYMYLAGDGLNVCRLLGNPDKLAEMKKLCKNLAKENSAEKIYNLAKMLVNEE